MQQTNRTMEACNDMMQPTYRGDFHNRREGQQKSVPTEPRDGSNG